MPERRTHVDGGELAGLLTLAGSSESFKACLAAYTDQPPWGELMKRMAGWKAVIRGAPTDTGLMVHIVLQPYPSEDSDGGHSAEFKRSILGVHGSQQFQAIRAIRLIAGKRSSFHVRPYCRAQRVAQRFTDGLHAVMCSNSCHHVGRVCPLAATSMQPAPLTADSEHNIRRVCSAEPANSRARNSHGTVASKPESSSGRPSCTSSRFCPARHPLLCDRTAVPQIP